MSDLEKDKHLAINEPLMEAESLVVVVEKRVAKPYLGYTFMILFVVSNSMADSASKILFINHPGYGVDELLFLRGVIFLGLLAYLLGKDTKHILYDSVPSNMVLPLAIRCCTGLLAFYCFGTAIKHLPIILVALF